MKLRLLTPATLFFLLISLYACNKNECLTPARNTLDLGSDQNQLNPTASLGRVLFYDTKLSVNNSISCGSCHKQDKGFSDNTRFSRGFNGGLTTRNTPGIFNLNDGTHLFWDGRDRGLTSMVLRPVLNHIEMGMGDLTTLVNRISAQPYYEDLFLNAFGTTEVTEGRIGNALAAFVAQIADMNITGVPVFSQNELTPLQVQGQNLFAVKYQCNGCHNIGMSNGYQMGGNDGFLNIGLDPYDSDPGRAAVTSRSTDAGAFKIPSLVNVALTAPYMHDGRFATLEQVIDHYSNGIRNNANLDTRLRSQGEPLKMNIPQEDKEALIAFLNSMTRTDLISNPTLSNPFQTSK